MPTAPRAVTPRDSSPLLRRTAAIGEILLVTASFNGIAALLLRRLLTPAEAALAEDYALPDLLPGAAVTAVRLVVRFGIAIAIGFALLWWRRRRRPADVGVTRSGRSWGALAMTGVVVWAVGTIPFDLLYIVNGLHPFGQGFPLLNDPGPLLGRFDFWIAWLAGAVVLPPLLEETFFRGYARGRLEEAYGGMGAVVVSSLLFMLAHGHFYSTDPVKALTLVANLFAVACWAYAALRTGSIVPGIVAHALGNMPWPRTVPFLGALVLIQLVIIAASREAVRDYVVAAARDWQRSDRPATRFGALLSVACLVPLMTMAAAGMRRPLVITAVAWLLVFTAAWGLDTVRERFSARSPG